MGEQIGHVNTGLSEDSISKQLKTRSYLSSGTIINLEEAGCPEKEVDFCIICQVTYNFEIVSVNNLSLFFLVCDHSVDIGSIYHLGIYPRGILDFTGLLQEPGEDRDSPLWTRISCRLLKEVVACEKCLPHLQIRSIDHREEECIEMRWPNQ